MTKKDRKQLLIALWISLPILLAIIPLFEFRKALIIKDGDYFWLGILNVTACIICFLSGAFLSYKNNGFHWYQVVWAEQDTNRKRFVYFLKMLFAFVFMFGLMFYGGRVWSYYSIRSPENNISYNSVFKIERISCSSRTLCQLKSIGLYSYSHKDIFYLDFPKEIISNSEVGTCIRLIGHRNKYGIYVEKFQKGAICSPYLQ